MLSLSVTSVYFIRPILSLANLVVGSLELESATSIFWYLLPRYGATSSASSSVRGLYTSATHSLTLPAILYLSLIHISEPTRQAEISYAVFCLKKKKKKTNKQKTNKT